MEDITFPQLLAANWVLLVVVLVVIGLIVTGVWRARRRRVRRLPITIDGVRIELQGAHLDEDMIVERNWRLTFLLTNSTKRPAMVPVLSSRAVVRSGRKQYAGTLYLERDVGELNPDEAMVAWLLCQLPGGGVPERVAIDWMYFGRAVSLRASIHPISGDAAI